MAGFFGLFNYSKEGPGIEKDAPKKKSFVVFFETFFRNFWKFIPINLVYSLISLPVLTNGLACAGITNITRNIARDKHSFGISDMFETIKKNWKQALPAGIINTLIYIILIFDLVFFYFSINGIASAVGIGIICCLLFIFTIMNYFIWTLIITFNLSLSQVYKNSFKFVFINIKKNLLCWFMNTLIIGVNVGIVALFFPYAFLVITIEILIAAVLYPSFKFLLIQYCVFPAVKKYIIDPYYLEHPEEDIDKRKNLGLEVEEESSEDEEDYFEDSNTLNPSEG